MSPRDAAIGTLVPLVISLAVLLVGRRPWAGPVAIAAGFCAIVPQILNRKPQPWPVSSPDCIFYIAIFVALVGVVDRLRSPPQWLRIVLAGPIVAAAMVVVLWRRLGDAELQTEALMWVGLGSVVAWLWWMIFELRPDPADRYRVPLAMLILTAFSSVVLGMSHSFIYGRIGMALTAALAPVVVISLMTQRYQKAASVIACVGPLAPLVLAEKVFADLTVLNLSLIALAPVCYLVGKLLAPRRWPIAAQVSISLILLTLPLGAAVYLQWPDFLETLKLASTRVDVAISRLGMI
jgi:hypothetical protein